MLTAATIALSLLLRTSPAQAAPGIPIENALKKEGEQWGVFVPRMMDDDLRRVQRKYSGAAEWLRGENLNALRMPNVTSVIGAPPDMHAAVQPYGVQPLTNYGEDSFYYGAVSVGTPRGQVLNVDIDTGSADLWVQSGCRQCTSKQFQPSKSRTFQQTGQPFSIQYGSGSASGSLGRDTVTIAGQTVTNQYFGLVNNPSSDFLGTPSSGLIGMAFSSIASSGQPTFFENLMAQNSAIAPFFSVYLTRKQPSGSQVCLGCYDRTKSTSAITWLPVVSKTYWTVAMNGALVGRAPVPSAGGLVAAIDTGTTLIYVPNAFAQQIYAQIPGSYLTDDGYYAAPCSTLSSTTVKLMFSGQPFTISPVDFNLGRLSAGSSYCAAGILGLGGDFPDNLVIVGDEFLKTWYSTYDYSNGARVGLSLASDS
ncbi:acid protease [Auricularia subglabra TFB-10046 SS5]|nr:acid protease [Auricularia subglabra TFB-10046 SS5]